MVGNRPAAAVVGLGPVFEGFVVAVFRLVVSAAVALPKSVFAGFGAALFELQQVVEQVEV